MTHANADTRLALIAELRTRYGERISTAAATRQQHGQGAGHYPSCPPDAVFFARTTREISDTVRLCHAHRCPVIAFGAGTSVEGHVAALHGGICIDMSAMNHILSINADDADCTVQAGITRKALNAQLRHTGLFFPIDPGADASLGGMCSTRASGTNAVRYGTMREAVLSLTVVLPDGEVIRTARRSRKSAAGYDLTRLFVGAEGTLGVITEACLRLHPVPEKTAVVVCPFPSLRDAVNATVDIMRCGITPGKIELMDEVQVDAINRYAGTAYTVANTLLLEFSGSPLQVQEQIGLAQVMAREHGADEFAPSGDGSQQARLWELRHKAALALRALRPSPTTAFIATDVCVPVSLLVECIAQTRADLDEAGLLAAVVGHVGDGNFHTGMVIDSSDRGEVDRAARVHRRMVRRALDLDGTCTGEHGVGAGKMDFLLEEHGPAVDVMRRIKRALDPANIMNPGKIFSFDGAAMARHP